MPEWTKALDSKFANAITNMSYPSIFGFIGVLCSLGCFWVPKYAVPLGLTAAALGNHYSKSRDQGSTRPQEEADAAIAKVEKMPPNTEPKT